MELASTGSGNAPKRYSMDMSKDFIPMSVFSESVQGEYNYLAKPLYELLLAWGTDILGVLRI